MDILCGIHWLWVDVNNALFKGWCQQFFVFVFNVIMFYFNDDDDVDDLLMVIWVKPRPLSRFTLCWPCAVVELCVTALRVQFVGGCATASWPEDDKVLFHRVDVRLKLGLNSPLLRVLCFLVIFKQMHLLSSVFFLVLIVAQIELKPLFFNMTNEKVQLLCITSELLRCATISSSSASDNFKQLCPWGSSTCCVTQWFGAQCRQGRVVLCLLFWQYAAHVLCQIQSSFIYKAQTNKPIGEKNLYVQDNI